MHFVNKVLLWSRDFFRFIFITLCSISTKVGSVCVSGIIISCRCFSKKFFCTFWNHLQVVLSTNGWLFRHWPGYALVIFTIASTSTMAFVKRTIVWHFLSPHCWHDTVCCYCFCLDHSITDYLLTTILSGSVWNKCCLGVMSFRRCGSIVAKN